MNLTQVVAYNTFVQVLGKAVTLLFGITTTALLANYLGPVGFGDYMFALSFVAIFSGMADWGTTLITVKEAARQKANQGQIFANVLLLRLGFSFLATVVAWLVIFFFSLSLSYPEFLRRLVLLSSTLIAIFALKNSLGIIFQTKLKMGRLALVDLSASLLTLFFSFLIIKIGGGVFFLISAIILANLAALSLAFLLAFPLVNLDFSLSWPILRQITYEALPMGGVLVIFSIYNRVDTLILQALRGSSAVGIYGVSYRVYEVLVLGAFYLMNSLLPIISQERDKMRLRQIYQKTFDILILAGLVIFLGTMIFAPLAIRVITWQRFNEFASSVAVLQILGLAALVSYLNHLTGYTIVVLGKQKRYLLITLGALTFNILTNLLLIPHFSFFGAAWTTVLTEGLVFFLTSFLIVRNLKFIPNLFSFPQTVRDLIKKKGRIFA